MEDSMKVEIYGIPKEVSFCQYCEMAKNLCKAKKIDFEFKPVFRKLENGERWPNEEIYDELSARLNRDNLNGLTMPQIFVDNRHVGGFTEFRKYLETNNG